MHLVNFLVMSTISKIIFNTNFHLHQFLWIPFFMLFYWQWMNSTTNNFSKRKMIYLLDVYAMLETVNALCDQNKAVHWHRVKFLVFAANELYGISYGKKCFCWKAISHAIQTRTMNVHFLGYYVISLLLMHLQRNSIDPCWRFTAKLTGFKCDHLFVLWIKNFNVISLRKLVKYLLKINVLHLKNWKARHLYTGSLSETVH